MGCMEADSGGETGRGGRGREEMQQTTQSTLTDGVRGEQILICHVTGSEHVVSSVNLRSSRRPLPTNLSEVCRRAVVSALVSLELHSENTLFRAHAALRF